MTSNPANPFELTLSDLWKTTYLGASAGIMAVSNIPDSPYSATFDEKRAALEQEIRERYSSFDRVALSELAGFQAYENYYKKFKKTYHVFLQFESVALKGKPIPPVPPLVGAMFMAELKNHLLTAGHDLSAIQGCLELSVARGNEAYTLLNGAEQTLKQGDMMISDQAGIISSIIYGPDQRTRISFQTRAAIYTVYAPSGISQVQVTHHLEDIRDFILLAYPEGKVEQLRVYSLAKT